MIELIAMVGVAAYGVINGICKIEDRRLPRSTYATCIGWWYGAFAGDSPAAAIARMIESDHDCQAWSQGVDNWGDPTDRLVNETMKITLKFNKGGYNGRKGLCQLTIKEAQKKVEVNTSTKKRTTVELPAASLRDIEIPVSSQDDYYLYGAYKRWLKRSKDKKTRDKMNEVDNLITERTTEFYNLLIERAQANINRTQLLLEDQSELVATLPPPPQPKNVVYIDAGKTASSR